MSTARAKWPSTKSEGVPCYGCDEIGTCTISPDHAVSKCWKDRGRLHYRDGESRNNGGKAKNVNGTDRCDPSDYGHKTQTADSKSKQSYSTLASAVDAALKTIEGAVLAGQWSYQDIDGNELAAVARYDTPDGKKEFRPFTKRKNGWKIGDPDGLWPLYQLPLIAAAQTVYVCEGEKAADAARAVDLPATTSAHGSCSADKTNWKPLADSVKEIIFLPDNDTPGEKYAADGARNIFKHNPDARIKILRLPGLPPQGDFVEFSEAMDTATPEQIRDSVISLAADLPYVDPVDYIGGIRTVCMADVVRRDVNWVWTGRIARGTLSLIASPPGSGKSWLVAYIAANISTGTDWTDGTPCPCGTVILADAENDRECVLRDRLDAHGADCSKVRHIECVVRRDEDGKPVEYGFTLEHVAYLEQLLLKHPDTIAICVDPVGSYIGRIDAHRDNEVRAILAPLAALARKHNVAVVLIAHTRKMSGGTADDSVLGSRGFVGIVRTVLHLICETPDRDSRRFLLAGKNNLGRQAAGLVFTIGGSPAHVQWEPASLDLNADQWLAQQSKPGPEPESRNQAAEWLQEFLADGSKRVGDTKNPDAGSIHFEAKAAGFSWRTICRARSGLAIKAFRDPFSKAWTWRLKV
jgi:hypothetical protein